MDHNKRLTKYSQVRPVQQPARPKPDSSASPAPTTRAQAKSKPNPLQKRYSQTVHWIRSIPLSRRSKLIIAGVVLIGTVCIIFAIITHGQSNTSSRGGSGQLLENIEYQTVLPAGKTITELGGWKRVSPPSGEPVYAYSDSLAGTPISVSQQPLPASFQGATERSLEEMAQRFNATRTLDAGGTKVHIGASSKGPQSVLFTKNYLLILIKSQGPVSDEVWAEYIKTLR